MKISVWNCNMAFHKKFRAADSLASDVLVVPECADEATLVRNGLSLASRSFAWLGKNNHKGLAIIARAPYKVEPLFDPAEPLPIWAAPFRISSQDSFVDLMAVWSFWYRDSRKVSMGNQVIAAIEQFNNRLCLERLLVAGDFNNNVIWDKRRDKPSNHRSTSAALSAIGLGSAYHWKYRCEYGAEPHPTIYWRDRTIDGPRYHIDYIYAPIAWLHDGIAVDVGSYDPWVKLSDHVPLSADFGRLV